MKLIVNILTNIFILTYLRHEASVVVHWVALLAPHSVLVKRLPLASALEVAEASVPRQLTANTEVSVKRPDRVRHPPALAVLHLHRRGHGLGHHGGRPRLAPVARHQVARGRGRRQLGGAAVVALKINDSFKLRNRAPFSLRRGFK